MWPFLPVDVGSPASLPHSLFHSGMDIIFSQISNAQVLKGLRRKGQMWYLEFPCWCSRPISFLCLWCARYRGRTNFRADPLQLVSKKKKKILHFGGINASTEVQFLNVWLVICVRGREKSNRTNLVRDLWFCFRCLSQVSASALTPGWHIKDG